MKSTSKVVLMVTSVLFLGLWGCSQNQNEASNAKIRQLEARYSKMEEDYQAMVAANDSIRKRLNQAEAKRGELAKQVEELKAVVRERDELRQQVTVRTGERDALHSQLVQFSKELHNLAGRIEAATNNAQKAVTVSYQD